jgi:hypothetical protein
LFIFFISVPDPDAHRIRIQLASLIQIRIPNADPDPGGVKSAEIEGKNGAKKAENSS